MYKQPQFRRTDLKINNSIEGQTIEQKVARAIANKENIGDNVELIYQERNEGVKAGFNIRTDRFDVALDGIDKIDKSYKARSESKAKMEIVKDENESGGSNGPESTQG